MFWCPFYYYVYLVLEGWPVSFRIQSLILGGVLISGGAGPGWVECGVSQEDKQGAAGAHRVCYMTFGV